MRSFDEILEEYQRRKDARGTFIQHMKDAADHVNGDVVVPLPEMDATEKPGTVNLIAHGLEHTAQRIASVLPNMYFPATIPGKDKGVGSEDWARTRKYAVTGWHQQSRMNLKGRRLARWLIGYGTSALEVTPDFDTQTPRFGLLNPLGAYPNLTEPWDDSPCDDIIYTYRRTAGWLKTHHPDQYRRLFPKGAPGQKILTMLEYQDADHYVVGVLAPVQSAYSHGHGLWVPTQVGGDLPGGEEIHRFANRTGMCNAVVSNRITFDRLMGAYHQMYGMYMTQATLMALETIAIKKGIFPDLAIVGTTPGRTPQLINGEWKDGRSGVVNVVRDGKVEVIQLNPGFLTQPTMDRIERSMRMQGNIPSQWGGETPGNISTGRLGDQILSATADFPIQEQQETLAEMYKQANIRAMEVAKAYFGQTKKVFHVAYGKVHGRVEYEPDKHFETTEHIVSYAAPGADLNSLVIGGGQRIGIGGMSIQTWLEQDPMVPDADIEMRRITSEGFVRSLTTFIEQQIGQGLMDPLDVIALSEEVQRGATLGEAWQTAQRRAQERQAEAAAAAQVAQPNTPDAEPGLSPAGAPGAGGTPAIGPPGPSLSNLSALLGSLRQPRAIASPMAGQNAPNQPVGGA